MPEDRRGSGVALLQLVNDHRRDADAGHARLRNDWRGHEARLEALEAAQGQTDVHFAKIDATPPPAQDVSKLKFSWTMVIFIVSLAGGMYASNYGIRSDMRDLLTQMAMRKEVDAAQSSLLNERFSAMQKAIEAMQRQQSMQQYETQALKELVLKGGRK